MTGPTGSAIFGIYSDAARRCADIINGHLARHGDNAWGRWVAIKMHDGGSDGVLYDRRAHAVRYQLHETMCAYIKIPPDGISYAAAQSFLDSNRKMYDAGIRLVDPETDREPIVPIRTEDFARWMKHLKQGRK